METILQGQQSHSALYREEIKKRSDKLMNYFLISFFAIGLILAPFYGTWLLAVGSGSGCLSGSQLAQPQKYFPEHYEDSRKQLRDSPRCSGKGHLCRSTPAGDQGSRSEMETVPKRVAQQSATARMVRPDALQHRHHHDGHGSLRCR